MSFKVTLVRALSGTFLGKEIKAFALRAGRRRLVIRFAELARRELGQVLDGRLIHIIGQLAQRARALHPRFQAKYSFLARFDENTWAEAVSQTIAEGDTQLTSLRGKVVERFIPDMKEMRTLVNRLEKLAASKGWKRPRLVSGARTPNGQEIADWIIVAEHADGRIWIMALVESKSISNIRDLAGHKGRAVGQHLWDVLRLKSEGLVLNAPDGKAIEYSAKRIEVHPVLQGTPPPTHGLTTDLVAVTPRDFTQGQLNRISGQGVHIDSWPWPVDEDDLGRMLRELRRELNLGSSSQ